MLVDPNRPVSTQRLVEVLWGQSPPSTAVQQVQNCVGTLRKLLSGLGVGAELNRISSSYSLTLSDEQIDAEQFSRMCADVEARARNGDLESASHTARRALGLWSGEALEDVGSDALAPAATRLEEMRLRAIEKYGQIELARGNNAGVVVEFSEWVGRYPYHENLHSYLALALHHVGRTAEGLRVLQDLRSRLRAELGIEVGAFVEKVHRGLLDSHETTGPHGDAPLVGADVLQVVRSALERLEGVVEMLSSPSCRSCGNPPPAQTSHPARTRFARPTNVAAGALPVHGRAAPPAGRVGVVTGEGAVMGG
ncbi:AfsR/SARP family transcriptional regulator [Micromonospora sp. NPDC052213]|uniref:AfsR/SARP family transcriptional regulator n=1 Tax=Micromonospora sp. NPDC052213 TaxID=3155812 RepID=UPI0034290D70